MTATPGYTYDQAWEQERARLAGLEALWDPGSQALLTMHGAAPGARVLEVGAGGGSVVEWLAARVAPDGVVCAVDIDVRFVERLASDVVTVERADIVNDELPGDDYDIAHARLVLEHLAEREQALSRMVDAVRPGGHLVVEDYDWTSFGFEGGDELDDRAAQAVLDFMGMAGFDRTYGRRVVGSLAASGLDDVHATGRMSVIDPSHPGYDFFRLSFEQLAPQVVAAGLLDEDDARVVGERMAASEGYRVITPTLVAAVGRRP